MVSFNSLRPFPVLSGCRGRKPVPGKGNPPKNKTYQATNNTTQVEDHPEHGKITTFLLLLRVGEDDSTLCSPEQTSANTEQGTCKDVEPTNILVDGDEERNGIDAVTNATEGKSYLNTKFVDESSTKKAKDSEGAIESSVL